MEKSENLVESLNNTKKTGYKYLGKKIIKQRMHNYRELK